MTIVRRNLRASKTHACHENSGGRGKSHVMLRVMKMWGSHWEIENDANGSCFVPH